MAAAERDVAIIVLFSSIASIACTRPTSPTAPVASGTATVSAAPAPSAQSPSAGLPKPDFGPRGPIVATGYPTKIGTGMDDYADWVGFTSDGARFGYCSHYGGLGQLDCVYRDASGTLGKDTDVVAHPETAPSPLDPLKTKAIEKWIASSGMSKMTPVAGTFQVLPPPLKGDWAYARDIELRVLTVDTVLDKSGKTVSQPFLRLGGVLKGEEPVWVVTSSAPRRGSPEIAYHFTVANGLHLSPDGNELGLVTHSYCMEYCDDFDIVRMTTSTFAGRVYNDAGFRHHKKGEYARAAELFSLAAFADVSAELYAYNLACALARLGDAKAKDALALAIARGGDKVKVRARADEDFAGVKSQSWFGDLTK